MKKNYFILAFILLSLIMGQKSYGQVDSPDYNIPAGGFGIGVQRGILDIVNQLNPAGVVNFESDDPTANVNITMVVSNDIQTSSNSYTSSSSSYSWGGINYRSLASVSSTSNCWICDVNNEVTNGSSNSNNLPNTSLNTVNSVLLGYSWDSSNNNLSIFYNSYTPLTPTVYTQEQSDEMYSKVRADLDRIIHPWDFSFESVTPSGVELWHSEEPQPAFGKIDSDDNVTIRTDDGTYKSPSQLDPTNPRDRRNLAKFAVYLGKSLDIGNKGIVIKTTIGTELSSENPAWTSRYDIYFNLKGGFSPSLNNVNNFKSVLKHEIFHVADNRYDIAHPNDHPERNLSTHVNVYLSQIEHATFAETTDDFKSGTVASLANYLMNMNRDTPEGNFSIITINNFINTFNLMNTGYRIDYTRPQSGVYTGKDLQLFVYKPNDTHAYPVPFKVQKN